MLDFFGLGTALYSLARQVPLHQFVFFGSFVEEVIATIPAPIIMTTAGSVALLQHYAVAGIFFLAVLGAIGKTGGSWLWYYIADKAEDLILPRIGKYFNISHAEIEHMGSYFRGSWKDLLILTFLRSIPVVPSLALSIVSGVIKLPLRVFLTATMIGDTIRGFIFLYIGYAGFAGYEKIATHVQNAESYAEIAFVALVIIILGILYWQRQTGGLTRWLKKRFSKGSNSKEF
ncbi:hypothetical protein A3D66_01060 [Candidatus Kaiserbacteria bacterium RIFCSPHIGHO2_02_FULL_50_9]|uniref:VTT domain-containing protein n=1 Tax=Candidatus Kaiserbacteria bacterium RIFCSPLOWO2_01_FULL_51_21 TaxID=1798508 RepID=A0A1F6ED25_9BACT|nr:MAG: hypothetical protein A2761_01855 [Candidatus Kaiserbacteria bacterium RIFCSPHIGHO2_01_FULL_51_33]OGG63242.1 MAG: hypothetical protein A3D66_01060 [Candidatus Kaiserbacteria bacterium RIFCSPHIGHO2_02_FULL_50_9]OGG71546.1 MAG: hypothetical protein A3A35_00155 [Candidatus Kaiserbacteria bacterium RIFCSPLOWO2_01_FULL_51_21]